MRKLLPPTFLIAISLALALAGNACASEPVERVEPDKPSATGGGITITFPVSDTEKTEFNEAIFAITPFDLSFELPDGWTTKEHQASEGYALFLAWSKVDVFDTENQCVGIIGYDIYEPYPGAEEIPQAIYSQIALGNNYNYDVRDSYAVVNNTDSGATAVTDVYYSQSVNNGAEMSNKGILSYNRDLQVYIAMEFDSALVTDEQINNIAASILIS
jgi:hypothetical protein